MSEHLILAAIVAQLGFNIFALVWLFAVARLARETEGKLEREEQWRREAIDRLGERVWEHRWEFDALRQHLGATIDKEPARLVVRVKGAPEGP